MNPETPTAPATPALSQIRAELKHLAEVHAGPGLSNTGVVKLLACATSLLSIADMLEQKQQWQPIETAPLDGTFVLLVHEFGMSVCQYDKYYTYPWRTSQGDCIAANFTHWMPLPTPPALRSIAQMEEGV